MKDWLSSLLGAKTDAVSAGASASDTLGCFLPLLQSVAALTAKRDCDVLAQVLFEGLRAFGSQMNALTKVPKSVRSSIDDSGHLDKLSDSTLSLALSFLDHRDRCTSVEPACHRLFHLSRATAIVCDSIPRRLYDYSSSAPPRTDATAIVSLLRRLRLKCLDLRYLRANRLWYDVAVNLFAATVRNVCVTFDTVDCVFPQLKIASLDRVNSEQAKEFLSRHSQLEALQLTNIEANDSFMLAVSKLRRLSTLELVSVTFVNLKVPWDFRYLTTVSLNGCSGECPKHLFQGTLKTATISSCAFHQFASDKAENEPLQLQSLEHLSLDAAHFRTDIDFQLVSAPNLKLCQVQIWDTTTLTNVLANSAAPQLTLCVMGLLVNHFESERALLHQLSAALQCIARSGRLRVLTVVVNGEYDCCQNWGPDQLVCALKPLFTWLAQAAVYVCVQLQVSQPPTTRFLEMILGLPFQTRRILSSILQLPADWGLEGARQSFWRELGVGSQSGTRVFAI